MSLKKHILSLNEEQRTAAISAGIFSQQQVNRALGIREPKPTDARKEILATIQQTAGELLKGVAEQLSAAGHLNPETKIVITYHPSTGEYRARLSTPRKTPAE